MPTSDFDAIVSQPRARATILFSESNVAELGMEDIKSINILRERRNEGRGVPYGTMAANQLILAFNKIDGYARADYKIGAKIEIEIGEKVAGDTNYVNAGTFYAASYNLSNEYIAVVTAYDWRYSLSSLTYFRMQASDNYEPIGNMIATALTAMGYGGYARDITGLTYVPPAIILPEMTLFQAITYMLAAGGGAAYMDNDGALQISDDVAGEPVKTLTPSYVAGTLENLMNDTDFCTAVRITWYTFTIAAAATTVIDATEYLTIPAGQSKTLFIKWKDSGWDTCADVNTPVFTVSGGMSAYLGHDEVNSPTGVYYFLSNTHGSLPLTVTKISEQGKPVTFTAHVYEEQDSAAVAEYGLIYYELDNKLIQTLDQAEYVAGIILSRYNFPNKWKVPTCGDPQLMPGDVISIPDNAESSIDIQIERSAMAFDTDNGFTDELLGRFVRDTETLYLYDGSDQLYDSADALIATREGYEIYG